MTATDDLYGFVVELETYEERFIAAQTREQWDAFHHRALEVRAAVHYERLDEHQPQDLLPAFTWAAGYLARLRLHVDEEIKRAAAKIGHEHCRDCGPLSDYYVSGFYPGGGPRMAVTDGPPSLTYIVPTEYAHGWADLIRTMLAHMVADETTPWPSTAPEQDDSHQPPTLTTQANDDTTRSTPQ